MLLHRYHNIEFILNLPFAEGFLLVNKAIEKQAEQRVWEMYIAKSVWASENYPTFDEIIGRAKKEAEKPKLTYEEIDKQTDEFAERMKKKARR